MSGPAPTGRTSWALGFLAWIPVPFLGMIVAAVAMVAVYPSVKRKQVPAAAENARRAANWGLTLLTVLVACGIYVLVLALAFPETHQGFFPIGLAVIVFAALSVVHAVVTIAGTVIAGKRVFRNRLAIPYLR
ncbi:MAG: hypothetical protein ABIO06_08155 [Pseudolysinimonas sp.]